MASPALPTIPEYRSHARADERIASALTAVAALLAADILAEHKRELLSICLWKISQAQGISKYKTRYVSAASLNAPTSSLAHDHVYERHWITRRLMLGEIEVDALRTIALACTVLRSEHKQLTALSKDEPGIAGWERYRKADIAVIDCKERTWLLEP